MKLIFVALLTLCLVTSCKNRSSAVADSLPKDISQKPQKEKILPDSLKVPVIQNDSLVTAESITSLGDQIKGLVSSIRCEDASKWRISPLGSKPCGGPASYIAYPKELENQVMPLITKYNAKSLLYNKQNSLVSDCSLVPSPIGIECQNEKAVLQGSKPTGDLN